MPRSSDVTSIDGLARYKSKKLVRAGEISEVSSTGCYVTEKAGGAIFRAYEQNMTVRYSPKVGDFWVVYDDGYQSLSPRAVFLTGYDLVEE